MTAILTLRQTTVCRRRRSAVTEEEIARAILRTASASIDDLRYRSTGGDESREIILGLIESIMPRAWSVSLDKQLDWWGSLLNDLWNSPAVLAKIQASSSSESWPELFNLVFGVGGHAERHGYRPSYPNKTERSHSIFPSAGPKAGKRFESTFRPVFLLMAHELSEDIESNGIDPPHENPHATFPGMAVKVLFAGGRIDDPRALRGIIDEIHYCVIGCYHDVLRGGRDPGSESIALAPSDFAAIAHQVSNDAPDYDGFVIATGTDNLSSMAEALNLLLPADPDLLVVLTSAHEGPQELISDSGVNLVQACQLLGHLKTERQSNSGPNELEVRESAIGVLVCMGGIVLNGGTVQKISDVERQPFASSTTRPVAVFERDKMCRLLGPGEPRPDGGLSLSPSGAEEFSIPQLVAHANSAPPPIDGWTPEKVPAVLIRCLGEGNLPPAWITDLLEPLARQGIVAVVTAAFPFRGIRPVDIERVLATGAIWGGEMTPDAMAVKLSFALQERLPDASTVLSALRRDAADKGPSVFGLRVSGT